MHTRNSDIEKDAVVRVGSLGVSDGRGADGDEGSDGRGLIGSVHIVVTSRDEVSDGDIDGSEVITAKVQGSNRRAATAASSASIPVHSINAVWNVGANPKLCFPRERARVGPGTESVEHNTQTNELRGDT